MKLNQLELDSLTTTQRDALSSPPDGCLIYNTTNGRLELYTGSAWEAVNKIATGTYTGDGTTSMAITGTGFKPKLVQIFKRETAGGTATSMFWTTPEIVDDHASGGSIAAVSTDPEHKFRTNAIISLDNDGFTVDDAGADLPPNTLNDVYNWIAQG